MEFSASENFQIENSILIFHIICTVNEIIMSVLQHFVCAPAITRLFQIIGTNEIIYYFDFDFDFLFLSSKAHPFD